MQQRFVRRVPARKRQGSLTVIAIPSSGEPPRSVGIPTQMLAICAAALIGVIGIFVISYLNMSRGIATLNEAKMDSDNAIEQLLSENQTLKLEKQERLAKMQELASKTQMLEATVSRIADEKAEIWAIVKGSDAAQKNASSSNAVSSRGGASRGGAPGAERESPEAVLDAVANAPAVDVGADAFDGEQYLVETMAEELEMLLVATSAMQKDLSDLRVSAETYRSKLDHTPSGWPVNGRITSAYGNRRHPILRITRFHEGVDIAATHGTPVVAAADGVVVLSGWSGGYGNAVEISHGFNCSTFYAHNSRNVVKVGQKVKKGQIIAYVGSTGLSTGPHCHYEVRIGGRHVDPAPYMK